MNHLFVVSQLVISFLFQFLIVQGSSVPGQGLLNGVVTFITGPFGKGITLIAIVLCGVSYMYGRQRDNSTIGRLELKRTPIIC